MTASLGCIARCNDCWWKILCKKILQFSLSMQLRGAASSRNFSGAISHQSISFLVFFVSYFHFPHVHFHFTFFFHFQCNFRALQAAANMLGAISDQSTSFLVFFVSYSFTFIRILNRYGLCCDFVPNAGLFFWPKITFTCWKKIYRICCDFVQPAETRVAQQ